MTIRAFLIGWLAMSGLIMFCKGMMGSKRVYTVGDAVIGVVEVSFLIWLVTLI